MTNCRSRERSDADVPLRAALGSAGGALGAGVVHQGEEVLGGRRGRQGPDAVVPGHVVVGAALPGEAVVPDGAAGAAAASLSLHRHLEAKLQG